MLRHTAYYLLQHRIEILLEALALAPGDAEAAQPRARRRQPVDEQEGLQRPPSNATERPCGYAERADGGVALDQSRELVEIEVKMHILRGIENVPDAALIGGMQIAQSHYILLRHAYASFRK